MIEAQVSGKKDLNESGKLRLRKTVILVTNDDGDCEGLRLLLEVAKRYGVAYALIPNRQRSAVSGALTLHKPIRLHKISEDISAINGTPSDCVLFALHSGHFQKPDIVLSGINFGDNTSLLTLFDSGTIGACWQSALEGVPSIAFSIERKTNDFHDLNTWGDHAIILQKIDEVVMTLLPRLAPDKFFNVNLPHNPKDARIVETNHFQKKRFEIKITKRLDPNDIPYYWLSGHTLKVEEGTDTYEVIEKRNITISEISLSVFDRKK